MTDAERTAHTREAGWLAILRWLARRDPQPVRVLCAEAPGPAGPGVAVRLPDCLLATAPADLVDLLRVGAAELRLDPKGCDDPERANARLTELTALLGDRVGLAPPPQRRGRPQLLEVTRPPVDRRGLFGLTRDVARPLPDRDSAPEARLRDGLLALGVVAAEIGPAAPDPAALHLNASGCVACAVCVHACPTGALELRHTEGRSTLLHSADQCLGEQQCIDTCPEAVMRSDGSLSWGDVLDGARSTLAVVETRRCQRCRAVFARVAEETLCPTCTRTVADPFGSYLPPAARAVMARNAAREPGADSS